MRVYETVEHDPGGSRVGAVCGPCEDSACGLCGEMGGLAQGRARAVANLANQRVDIVRLCEEWGGFRVTFDQMQCAGPSRLLRSGET